MTGLRSFTARPLLSGDEHGADKFKMERYLHDGRHTMASVFAPISYPPLPALLFKASGRWPRLVPLGVILVRKTRCMCTRGCAWSCWLCVRAPRHTCLSTPASLRFTTCRVLAINFYARSLSAPFNYSFVLRLQVPADGGPAQLAASGALRSCNPDRVVLKKIVLTGYPVRETMGLVCVANVLL